MKWLHLLAFAASSTVALLTAASCGPAKDCHVDGECMLTCKSDPQRSDAECKNNCTECSVGPQETEETDDGS